MTGGENIANYAPKNQHQLFFKNTVTMFLLIVEVAAWKIWSKILRWSQMLNLEHLSYRSNDILFTKFLYQTDNNLFYLEMVATIHLLWLENSVETEFQQEFQVLVTSSILSSSLIDRLQLKV